MDAGTVTTIISTLGFPIFMCVAMGWFIVRSNDTHKEEAKQMTEAIQNNTLVIQKLVDKLDKDGD